MKSAELTCLDDRSLLGCYGGQEIFRYVFRPEVPADESPKPYCHPLRSLDGVVLTDFQPADHRWHHGLSMTLTRVGSHNFWGGPSYRRVDGYVDRGDQGWHEHVEWVVRSAEETKICLHEQLAWSGAGGEPILDEERRTIFDFAEANDGWYVIRLTTRIRNLLDRPVHLDTYASSEDLHDSPYTGWQWRGRAGFLDPQPDFTPLLRNSDNAEGIAAVHGQPARWLALVGACPGEPATTLIFRHRSAAIDDRQHDPDHPFVFFVRDRHPQISFSFVGRHSQIVPAEGTLSLDHEVLVGTGQRTREEIAKAASM